ncbi:MAG: DNA-directed RNA polymerase [Candidatus Sungbacteria bacterium]|nr:DNA-directed RNA polymerase [Candidatus Sungbacteria bacterium]
MRIKVDDNTQDGGGFNDRRPDGGGFGGDRPKFPATCSKCGKETTVPFQPTEGRPVYCFECFKEVRGDRPPRRNFGGPRREF